MGHVIVLLLFSARVRDLERQPVEPAVNALEVEEAGQELRLALRRAVARRSDKAGDARAHSFDGLAPGRAPGPEYVLRDVVVCVRYLYLTLRLAYCQPSQPME